MHSHEHRKAQEEKLRAIKPASDAPGVSVERVGGGSQQTAIPAKPSGPKDLTAILFDQLTDKPLETLEREAAEAASEVAKQEARSSIYSPVS